MLKSVEADSAVPTGLTWSYTDGFSWNYDHTIHVEYQVAKVSDHHVNN